MRPLSRHAQVERQDAGHLGFGPLPDPPTTCHLLLWRSAENRWSLEVYSEKWPRSRVMSILSAPGCGEGRISSLMLAAGAAPEFPVPRRHIKTRGVSAPAFL